MCVAQGHNTVKPVRLEPVAPRSRVKHSTTEPLKSAFKHMGYVPKYHEFTVTNSDFSYTS